jgi:NAD(P)H-quinone oxidoreductase subunit 4
MLRNVFYGVAQSETTDESTASPVSSWKLSDVNPREAFIALCLLIPIIGIGLYPKLATQTYDSKTVAVVEQVRNALPIVADQPFQQFAQPLESPTLVSVNTSTSSNASN